MAPVLWTAASTVAVAAAVAAAAASAASVAAAFAGPAARAPGDASEQAASRRLRTFSRQPFTQPLGGGAPDGAGPAGVGATAAALALGLAAGLVARLRGAAARRARPASATSRRALKELTDRQQEFWELLDEGFIEEVIPRFGRDTLDRVYEFMEYAKYQKAIPPLPEGQECDPEWFPGLTAKPWWQPEECGDWIRKVEEGLPYVQGELADFLEENEEALLADSVKNDVMGAGWSGFRLQRMGAWIQRNADRFPQTVQLLKDSGAPLAQRGVIIARQVPNSGVMPHSDGRNVFLTAHFGLSIPPDCSITVGGETRPWLEDKAVILDTSFTHSTRNDSDEDRFVLIVDFWHPELTEPEWEAVECIYDTRTKFEQGKIKGKELRGSFFDQLYQLSAQGGGKLPIGTTIGKEERSGTLGGFKGW
mmetsp:Transcript_10217/g.26337  ORF Transcript_10217/g.26337 Transcript_10217/m.26337 type:complete len:421 (-) Transcript_10217:93-1355(-)